MRLKSRYLLLEFHYCSVEDKRVVASSLTERDLVQVIRDAVVRLHGDYGLACVLYRLAVKYLNVITDVAIVRAPRDYYRLVWSAITIITSVKKAPCAINIIHIGGTIKSCQRFLVKYNKKKLQEMIDRAKDPAEKRKIKEKIDQVLKKDQIPLKC